MLTYIRTYYVHTYTKNNLQTKNNLAITTGNDLVVDEYQ